MIGFPSDSPSNSSFYSTARESSRLKKKKQLEIQQKSEISIPKKELIQPPQLILPIQKYSLLISRLKSNQSPFLPLLLVPITLDLDLVGSKSN